MSFDWPDPYDRLFRREHGEELTPELARELWAVCRERGEETPSVMLKNMNALQIKSLRDVLANRLEQREARIAQRKADERQKELAAIPPRRQPEIEWAIAPSGALVDAAERRRDDATERARAESIAAQREAQLEDAAVDAEAARRRQAAADEHFLSGAPPHLRP